MREQVNEQAAKMKRAAVRRQQGAEDRERARQGAEAMQAAAATLEAVAAAEAGA